MESEKAQFHTLRKPLIYRIGKNHEFVWRTRAERGKGKRYSSKSSLRMQQKDPDLQIKVLTEAFSE